MGAHEGRVAIVTGAASGIGRAVTEELAGAGASVVAVDLDKDLLGWVDGIEGIVAHAGDVTEESSNRAMVEAALQRFGRLDTVILNAGLAGTGSLDGMPLEDFERILAVNLRGVVLGLRAAVPALRESGRGSVVATASVSGLGGDPGMWAYNAAKGGVVNFVRSAALNLASDNIRVNCVCPGPTRTGMTRALEESTPEVFEGLRRHVPLQRWGEAHEVASVICFLASPAASFVTGVIVPVDGGVTASTGQFLPPEKV